MTLAENFNVGGADKPLKKRFHAMPSYRAVPADWVASMLAHGTNDGDGGRPLRASFKLLRVLHFKFTASLVPYLEQRAQSKFWGGESKRFLAVLRHQHDTPPHRHDSADANDHSDDGVDAPATRRGDGDGAAADGDADARGSAFDTRGCRKGNRVNVNQKKCELAKAW
jgi:hypothetical protein